MKTLLERGWGIFLGLLVLAAVFLGARLTVDEIVGKRAASSIYGWDTSFYYFWLRSGVIDFDVDFSNEVRDSDGLSQSDKVLALQDLPRTEAGYVPNKYPVGWAVFHAPWFVAGHVTAITLEKAGVPVRTDGFGRVYEAFVYAGSLFYTGLSLWLTYRILAGLFSRRVAWASLVLVWVSSFLVFYQLRQYAMAHGLTYLCVVAAFHFILAIRDCPPLKRSWFFLGLSVGMLAITRYQAVVYLLFPFVLALRELFSRRASVSAGLVCVFAMALPIALQLACWKILYGSWLVYTYQGEGFLWSEPAILRALFDANHGLLYWHPVFAMGLLGFAVFVFKNREQPYWLALFSIAGVLYMNAAWHCWWFGTSFGGRAYEGVTLFVFLGVAALLDAAGRRGKVAQGSFLGLLVLLAVWNLGVLDAVMHSWKTGVGLEGAERYRDLGKAVLERWF